MLQSIKKSLVLMIRFSITIISEVFPFYSCVYILHKYAIILTHNLFIHHLKIKFKFMGFDIEIKIKDLDISFCSKYWLSVHSTKLFLFILFNFLPKNKHK